MDLATAFARIHANRDDSMGWQCIIDEVKRMTRSLTRNEGLRPEDVQDVGSDVVVALFRRREATVPDQPHAYLKKAIRSKLVDRARKSKQMSEIPSEGLVELLEEILDHDQHEEDGSLELKTDVQSGRAHLCAYMAERHDASAHGEYLSLHEMYAQLRWRTAEGEPQPPVAPLIRVLARLRRAAPDEYRLDAWIPGYALSRAEHRRFGALVAKDHQAFVARVRQILGTLGQSGGHDAVPAMAWAPVSAAAGSVSAGADLTRSLVRCANEEPAAEDLPADPRIEALAVEVAQYFAAHCIPNGAFHFRSFEELCLRRKFDVTGEPLPEPHASQLQLTTILVLRHAESAELADIDSLANAMTATARRLKKRIQNRYAQRHKRALSAVDDGVKALARDERLDAPTRRGILVAAAALYPSTRRERKLRQYIAASAAHS